jgi:predicted lipoprotein with Yx(FWY)xxD motif
VAGADLDDAAGQAGEEPSSMLSAPASLAAVTEPRVEPGENGVSVGCRHAGDESNDSGKDHPAAAVDLVETMVRRNRASLLVATACTAWLLSACGSGTTSTTLSSAGAAPAVTIRTATGRDGTYLTDLSGRALYMWVGDTSDRSNCSADCAGAWPPLITGAAPKASGGARGASLGTIRRADGRRQVTYHGHPLYYFAVDSGPGTTKGQGSDSFGARWWLVAPSGAAITVNGSSSVSPPVAY